MSVQRLTAFHPLATSRAMMANGTTAGTAITRSALARAGMVMVSGLGLTGCISISAPDKPIVIELNINVKQEVVYRLAADANKTIEDNKQIF
jgi:hypothetical protein